VADRPIRKGEKLTELNLAVKRPGIGLDPMRWDEVIGTIAIRDFQPDDAIAIS
jgi:N,N'-diacetyllegionaminate synthase